MRHTFLLDSQDLTQLDLNLDDYTIGIIAKASYYQARKISEVLFPDHFPDTPAPYCDAYFKVKAEEVWALRKELGLH